MDMLLAADLSFRAPGIVALTSKTYTPGGTFYFSRPSVKTESLKGYNAEFLGSVEIMEVAKRFLGQDAGGRFVFEAPPPRGTWAPGLHALDTMVAYPFWVLPKFEVYWCSALLVKSVLGGRKKTKKDSIELAISLLNDYKTCGYFLEAHQDKLLHNTAKSFEEVVDIFKTHDGLCEALIIMSAFRSSVLNEGCPAFEDLNQSKCINFQLIPKGVR